MNKNKVEGEADVHFSKQSKSIIYSVLEHEACENQRIPINPNLLSFKDDLLEYRYDLALLCHKGNTQEKSKEFQNNMLVFYIFFTLYIAITVTTSLLLYSEGNQKEELLITRLIILGFILILGYTIAYLLFKSPRFLMKSKTLLAILSFVIIIYLVLCDERVLSAIFSKDYEKNCQNHTLILACFLIMIRIVIFDSFFLITILTTLTLISSIALLLSLSTLSPFAILSDYLVLFVFLLLQTIDCHQVEYRARQLFWRRDQEEEALDPMASQGEDSDKAYAQIHTEVELLLQACDKIKQNIKQASAVIMYKDVKTKLKAAQTEMEKVKRGIAHGLAMHDVKLEGNGELDEDDKVFISEYCMDKISSDKVRGRHQTMGDVREINPSFPFSTYGVAELDSVLFSVGKNWNFDIWFVYQVTGHSIFIVGKYLFERWSLNTTFSINEDTTDRFFQTLEKNYHQNPYHNACHAADVLHSLLYFLTTSGVHKSLNPVDIISLIVACLGHDVGHPALTNRFLINNRDDIAFQYNDNSVLENMHISKTYSIMNKQGCNIFENLDQEDWPKSRKLVIEMILETDMMKHFEILGRFRARAVNLADLALENQDDKLLILSMGLKCGDIGHSAKIPELHEKWTSLVCEEFFRQGDLEKQRKQQVSMYCDRDTTDLPKSQSGFIRNICMPLYEVWCSYLNSEEINKNCMDQLKKNLSYWDEKTKARRTTVNAPDNSVLANGNDKK